MFDIEHMKKAREQGIMLVPCEVDELINQVYAEHMRKKAAHIKALDEADKHKHAAAAKARDNAEMQHENTQLPICTDPAYCTAVLHMKGSGMPMLTTAPQLDALLPRYKQTWNSTINLSKSDNGNWYRRCDVLSLFNVSD
jgi:hypothetical protein